MPSLFDLYRSMLRIRRTEEALAERYAEQEIRCPMHLCVGQEASAVGVSAALEPGDGVFGNHRSHGHYLAAGGDLTRMLAELYGRATGCAGGRGGSMHLVDREAGFLASTPIVGGTVPLAVGWALAARLRGEANVAVAFFGDACFEEGVVHEALNFGALQRLPVVFACENNRYAVATPLAVRQPERPIHEVARAHGWDALELDGNDVVGVADAASGAFERARSGAGPQFLELHTDRWLEHCGPESDAAPEGALGVGGRSVAELAEAHSRCPIERLARTLEARRDGHRQLRAIAREVDREVEGAFRLARRVPAPTAELPGVDLYAV